MDYLTTHTSLSPIRRGFAPGFVNYKKGGTQLAVASDKVYQLLVHGRWVSPGTPASSTAKTGRHDIDEILLKVALKHKKLTTKNQIIDYSLYSYYLSFGHCILRLSGCPPLTSSNFSGEENETINIQIRVFIVLKVVYLS